MTTKIKNRDDPAPLDQPIVLFGGFLSSPHTYRQTAKALEETSGQKVSIVPVRFFQWLPSITAWGWELLLNELEETILQAVRESPSGKITLVGHSSGGVLSRRFLSPDPFRGHAYRGLRCVNRLITLGSPHQRNIGSSLHHRLERNYPGAHYATCVDYVSVAGKAICGERSGTFRQRRAYLSYKTLSGEGRTWGDGLVPLGSAILKGSFPIILEGVRHYAQKKHAWYGSREAVSRWWNLLCDRERS